MLTVMENFGFLRKYLLSSNVASKMYYGTETLTKYFTTDTLLYLIQNNGCANLRMLSMRINILRFKSHQSLTLYFPSVHIVHNMHTRLGLCLQWEIEIREPWVHSSLTVS